MNRTDAITIIIVAHGRASVVAQTLAGLAQCDQPANFEQTIVAENGPPCGMAEAMAPFQDRLRIKHLVVADKRKSVALNEALKLAETGWALFIDDDVRVSRDWISLYAQAFANDPERFYFGGPTAADYEQRPVEWLIKYLPSSAKGLEFDPIQDVVEYPTGFLGFNWAARVNDLLAAGGFPEQYGPGTPLGGGDESFMQRKLAQIGLKGRVLHSALVWHQVPANRCSPEWCLKRFHAGGFSIGVEAEQFERTRRRCCGDLQAHLRHLRTQLATWPWSRLWTAEGRFAVRRTAHWMRGFRAGYQSSRRNEYALPTVGDLTELARRA